MRILALLAGAVALLSSCNKDIGPVGELTEAEHTLTLRVVADNVMTRAIDSDAVPVADGLHRLDLYVFHEDEPLLDEHITLDPDPSGVTTYSFKEKSGERIGVLAIGNLDEDTAEYLEGKTLTQLSNYRNPEAWIVLSANNFDTDRILMVGARSYSFSKDGTADINLRRLMYRIEVGKITVAPENEELIGKEIFVKNIALTNVCNYFVPLKSNSLGYFNNWYLFFGSEGSVTGALGGIEKGYSYYMNSPEGWSTDGSFAIEGPGILNGSFPYLINSNVKKNQGVLNITATGTLKDAMLHTYDNVAGEGLLANAGDMTASHSMNVNKCFYGYMGRGVFNNYNIVCENSRQNEYPKLVIELSIDGKSWFYPIPLIHPQPNTVYRINNITIKDYGSEYSNYFPLKYVVDFTISVAEWSEITVENMNVGADPVTGEPVELYDEQ